MGTLAIINPSTRKSRRKSRKHRSAAQRAATARLVAFNKSRRRSANPKRRRTHAKRRHSPTRHYGMNPAPRKTAKRRSRRRGSAGTSISTRGIMGAIKPAAIGAVGAVAVQAVGNGLGNLLPAGFYSGYTKYAVNAAIAIALGKYGRRFLGGNAIAMQNGALAITAYQVIRDMINGTTFGASFGLSGLRGLGYQGSAPVFPGRTMLPRPGMSEYFPDSSFNGVNASGGLSEYFPTF